MTQPRILMCSPEFYGIEYEINAWMHRERPSDHAAACTQWQSLKTTIESAGADVITMSPVPGLPDLVFTANAALLYHDVALLARFRHSERQGEEPHDEGWLTDHEFRVEHIPAGFNFEGAGDALFCGDTLFAGYRLRSDAQAHQWIGARLGCRVIPLELVDPYYYHLDTCFCPLAPGVAIYYPGAFDAYGAAVLKELVPKLVPVSRAEAQRFACNAVVVGPTVITNTGCPELHRALSDRGFSPREMPLDEFVKAGGSAKCLTLRLDGEDAASWRNQPTPAAA
ncbi:MAG TPA: arginine deiminase-related protein [Pirellulales bacterium]